MFSILWRFLYSTGSCGIGTFRLALDGMQAVILDRQGHLETSQRHTPCLQAMLWRWVRLEHESSAPVIAHLPFAQQHDQRPALAIVILDKSNDRSGEKSRYSGAKFVAHAGIPVFIDHQPAIAHNKIVIIDRHLVITGSYNFTRSAERRNAENVTFIDSAEVASRFLSNWNARRAVSRAYGDHGQRVEASPIDHDR
jgi:hypothetical protein